MKDQLKKSTRYFSTFEAREEAFRERIFSLIPRKYSGPRLFWQDFGNISFDELIQFIRSPIAYITSNPRDCLVFGTPWQVLAAAELRSRSADHQVSLDTMDIAEAFGIKENLYQPIRTLSGGETVKVSLAKSFIAASYSKRLTIASPFSWLSRKNFIYFQKVYQHYHQLAIPIDVFALEGEDSHEQIGRDEFNWETSDIKVGFNFYLKDVSIPLGSSLNPIYSEQTYARVENFSSAINSPCLIIGDNGQGKSLIAKILAGALPFQGTAEIENEGPSGPPRLLFQDVMTQTLLRSFDAIATSSICEATAQPLWLYENILNHYLLYRGQRSKNNFMTGLAADDWEFRSLLEVKTILVAIRLCGQPAAIIIDEPDWGLTRAASIALVAAIIKVCHQLGIPVILISHRPWWLTIANSILRVQRTPKEKGKRGTYSFKINIKKCFA
jgi:energy-coupling factor transporter ATP-binding protein EcfA2